MDESPVVLAACFWQHGTIPYLQLPFAVESESGTCPFSCMLSAKLSVNQSTVFLPIKELQLIAFLFLTLLVKEGTIEDQETSHKHIHTPTS
eukprot:scaffold23_cov175-Amphora_coffeaeformis.AAC.10